MGALSLGAGVGTLPLVESSSIVTPGDDQMITTISSRKKRKNQDDDHKLQSSSSSSSSLSSTSSQKEQLFYSHQTERWLSRYEDLLDYRLKNGHCLVPNKYEENSSLAEWVKRQRYQYKLKCFGKSSTLTDDRIDALWEERIKELVEYKRKNSGNTNVPSNYSENPPLAVWIKRQRRQYKFLMEGKSNTMTPYRMNRLNQIKFSWNGRKK